MAEQPHATIPSLSMSKLRKIFLNIYGLPHEAEPEIEKIHSLYEGVDILFYDSPLDEITCMSRPPELSGGLEYASLPEVVTYMKTGRGLSMIEGHQVVGCKPVTIAGVRYRVAVGILYSRPSLFFLPVGTKKGRPWPQSAIFLKFKPPVKV